MIKRLAVVTLLVLTGSARADWELVSEQWYVLELNATPTGFSHERHETDGSSHRVTVATHMHFSRAGATVDVETRTTTLEGDDGTPIRIDFDQKMSRERVERSWVFEDDGIRAISEQGGRAIETQLDRPDGDWRMPVATQRYWEEQFEKGATRIAFSVIDPESGLEPVEVRTELVTRERDYDAPDGRTIPVSVWHTEFSSMPGVVVQEMVSEDGVTIRDETDLPFGLMVTRMATREEAERAIAGAAPELLVSSFIEVDEPVNRPRDTTTSEMLLTIERGELPDLPTTGVQRVVMADDRRSAVLHVDLHHPIPADAGDAAMEIYTVSTTMIDKDHALIRKLSSRAARRGGEDVAERAESMRSYVHRYINRKGYETAFASASETARMRTGDCSEHAVLLCAMLRADGIPSRVATGLVYADVGLGSQDFFGWHMWTQALIDGHWVDYDATLEERYDAVHVLTATSSLNDAEANPDMASLLMLMGNLEIDVVEVGYEGLALTEILPPRRPDGHKGTFGTVLVVGGCAVRAGEGRSGQVMVGGPALTARAALRSGAGLAILAVPEPIVAAALTITPSATGLALPVGPSGDLLAAETARVLDPAIIGADVVALGPGFGRGEPQRQIVLRLLAQDHTPVIADADALNAMADMPDLHGDLRAPLVITPHPGEYVRLARAIGIEVDPTDPERRRQAAELMAQRLGCVVVLKGAATVISDGQTTIENQTGNVALATGGTGDVLTGIIAGLAAQFSVSPDARRGPFTLRDAAVHGVRLHGRAADLWAARHGDAGLMAAELADLIPDAMDETRRGP